MKLVSRVDYRRRRHCRLRRGIRGTSGRPRMSVMVSNRHMYVQFIDDVAGCTLAAASTLVKGGGGKGQKNNVAAAKELGKNAARAAKERGIESVVFDRGGFTYHGRVKAVADAAREEGLRL